MMDFGVVHLRLRVRNIFNVSVFLFKKSFFSTSFNSLPGFNLGKLSVFPFAPLR